MIIVLCGAQPCRTTHSSRGPRLEPPPAPCPRTNRRKRETADPRQSGRLLTRPPRAFHLFRRGALGYDGAGGRSAPRGGGPLAVERTCLADRKSTRLNSSHLGISYAVFCLK